MMLAFLIDQVQEAACSLLLSGQGGFIKKDLMLTGGGQGNRMKDLLGYLNRDSGLNSPSFQKWSAKIELEKRIVR